MRPLLVADLDLAARVLLAVPGPGRRLEMDAMLETARRADLFRSSTGQLLVGEGDGSLLSVALSRQRAAPRLADREYRACLLIVLERIAALGI